MARKAIIGLESGEEIYKQSLEIAKKLDKKLPVPEADYYLNFETAAQLFAELSHQRMRTLETLKATGVQTIYALAKRLKRHYSNVHNDITKLIEHGLVKKNKHGRVFVPWVAIEIHVALADKVA